MRPNGSRLRAITSGDVQDSAAAWSPDSTRIAFVRPDLSAEEGVTQIYVVNADGTGLRRLTNEPSTAKDAPTWSPNGRELAYVSFGSSGSEDLWVMRSDGTRARQLTTGGAYDYAPAWSPDGARIAFARNGDIWVMRADGSRVRRLAAGPGRDGELQWSPNGRELVFTRDNRIIVMNADGSHERRVPLGRRPASSPSLEPS